MPEFQLKTRQRGSHPYFALDSFAKGYVEAMFFTNGDTGDERENYLNELGTERLTRESVADIAADCERFRQLKMKSGLTAEEWLLVQRDYDFEQAGRDFWFSRNHHGVGFWDRDQISDADGNELTSLAHQMGETNAYTNRGWIYHS